MRRNDRIQKLKWNEPLERFDRNVQVEDGFGWKANHVMAIGWAVLVLVALPFGVDHLISLESLGFLGLGMALGAALFVLPEKEQEPPYKSVVEIDGDGILVRGSSGIWFSRFEDLAGYVIRDQASHRMLVLFLSPTMTRTIWLSREVSERDLENVLSRAGVKRTGPWRRNRERPAAADNVSKSSGTPLPQALR